MAVDQQVASAPGHGGGVCHHRRAFRLNRRICLLQPSGADSRLPGRVIPCPDRAAGRGESHGRRGAVGRCLASVAGSPGTTASPASPGASSRCSPS
jgi:hypothetical protein